MGIPLSLETGEFRLEFLVFRFAVVQALLQVFHLHFQILRLLQFFLTTAHRRVLVPFPAVDPLL